MTISVCMIVKDEELVLGRILAQAKRFADEIIVVDTGSKDKTVQIAKSFTSKVFDFKWTGDFSEARNYSFSLASCDYIMWLDADDYILDEDIEKINKLKAGNMQADIYMFEYVLTHESDMTPIFKYMRERLFKRSKNFRWTDPVHEVICLEGDIRKLDIKIYHKKEKPAPSGRNLKIYRRLKREGKVFSARSQFYFARELMFNEKYKQAIAQFKQFLDRDDGWVENKIDACLIRAKCYMLEKKYQDAKISLTQSFAYAPPRANICCELGRLYFNEKNFRTAKFWYKLALHCEKNKSGWIEPDYFGYIPAIQLCVCCFALGEKESARHYHNLSKIYKPNSPQVLFNEKFFT